MGKKKITGTRENTFSFQICKAKKDKAPETQERKLRRPVLWKRRHKPLRGQTIVVQNSGWRWEGSSQ